MISNHHTNSASGFALLLTLLIVSVALAVALSVADITLKQIKLTITGRDSAVAFGAADAGYNCMLQARNRFDLTGTLPGQFGLYCGGELVATSTMVYDDSTTNVHIYSFSNTWNISGSNNVCTDVSMYILDARGGDMNYSLTNEGLGTATCDEGGMCTFIFSRGFNKPCALRDTAGTIQRELTVTL